MQVIKIRLIRVGSFMSRHVPYEVWFNEKKLSNILKSESVDYTITPMKGVLRIREVGSKFAFHSIEKSVVVFPEHIKNADNTILCEVIATINWLGILTIGLLAPIRRVAINVKY